MPDSISAGVTEHLLKPDKIVPHALSPSGEIWVSVLLFLLFLLFITISVNSPKRFQQIISGFFTGRAVSQLIREEYAISNRVSVLLSLLFILNLSLFIYLLSPYYQIHHTIAFTGLGLYTVIVLGVTIGYALKIMVARVFGSIFNVNAEVSEYIFNIFLFNNAVGVFFLPVTISMAFMESVSPYLLIKTGYLLLAISFIIRILRSINGIVGGHSISLFYLFLYLCTFEILPLVLLIKVFII